MPLMVVSELKVLKSNAGYYVGRQYHDVLTNCWLPYSRESRYFGSVEEASAELIVQQSDTVETPSDEEVPF